MPLSTLPPIPVFSLFLFAVCGIIFVFGMSTYIVEKRKELKKDRDQEAQSKRFV